MAAEEAEIARFIKAMARVQQEIGEKELTITDYRAIQPKLAAAGEDVPSSGQLMRYFGSWKPCSSRLRRRRALTASGASASATTHA